MGRSDQGQRRVDGLKSVVELVGARFPSRPDTRIRSQRRGDKKKPRRSGAEVGCDVDDQFSVDGVVISTSGWITCARPCDSGAGIEPVGVESGSSVSAAACSAWRGASTAGLVVSILAGSSTAAALVSGAKGAGSASSGRAVTLSVA